MVSEHNTDQSLEFEVGTSVFIDNREWIIAEKQTGLIKLQRDSIDGTSKIMDATEAELQELVKKSQHQLEN
jgi:hypothetical protein